MPLVELLCKVRPVGLPLQVRYCVGHVVHRRRGLSQQTRVTRAHCPEGQLVNSRWLVTGQYFSTQFVRLV